VKDGLARVGIDEGEVLGRVLRVALDDGLLGGLRLVADLIDEDLQLGGGGVGEEAGEAECETRLQEANDGAPIWSDMRRTDLWRESAFTAASMQFRIVELAGHAPV
jgi:hypothetical protein